MTSCSVIKGKRRGFRRFSHLLFRNWLGMGGGEGLPLHYLFCFSLFSLILLILHFTESQNHRMVGVGRNLWGSSTPNPLTKQDHLEQAAQDLVQVGFEYLQRRRLHNLPGQPIPVLRHPQSEEVLPHVQMDFPMLQFVPIVLCLWALLKRVWPHPLDTHP